MKIAVAATTIHMPHAVGLLNACTPSAKIFIATDEKTPLEVADFCNAQGVAICDFSLGWKCSPLLGKNTMSRRNVAFLNAIAWGADAVVAWDCDNFPLNKGYFSDFAYSLHLFDGIQITGNNGWVDIGQYLRPQASHRGYPIQRKHDPVYSTITSAKIGVSTGLIINDPDVDAVTRIANAPDPHQVSLLAEAGVVVDCKSWTVFNTQSTIVIRELIPAWFVMPGVGRMDDIYASLIVQRVARERGYHVRFGKPFALQQRHPHNLLSDLRAEIDGMEHVEKFADFLDAIPLLGKSVIDDTRIIYGALRAFDPVAHAVDAAMAYLEDCESIL